MRYMEWFILFILGSIATALANYISTGVSLADSLPGLLILLGICMLAVFLSKIVPFKLPIIAYASILGLLLVSSLNPWHLFVIEKASLINFAAPFSMVGAFAGISISNQLDTFLKQGPKILIVGLLVMTTVFLGSVIWSTLLLTLSGVI